MKHLILIVLAVGPALWLDIGPILLMPHGMVVLLALLIVLYLLRGVATTKPERFPVLPGDSDIVVALKRSLNQENE